jgi:hypothetical protein
LLTDENAEATSGASLISKKLLYCDLRHIGAAQNSATDGSFAKSLIGESSNAAGSHVLVD